MIFLFDGNIVLTQSHNLSLFSFLDVPKHMSTLKSQSYNLYNFPKNPSKIGEVGML